MCRREIANKASEERKRVATFRETLSGQCSWLSVLLQVYVTPLRRNAMGVGLVFTANLHTKEHLSIWVLQGAALVLNNDD